MVEVWWSLLGAAIPAVIAGQAIRIKRKHAEEQRIKSARGREKSSDEIFVCERVCTSKRMLKKIPVLALFVLISIKCPTGTIYVSGDVRVNVLNSLPFVLLSALSFPCQSKMEPHNSNKGEDNMKKSSYEEGYSGVPIHSQVMKIKQEFEIIRPPLLLQPGWYRGDITRQRSRSPLGLSERPISVGN
ncbi:hypothetical protein HS088_TW13G00655 [Tripterygium wilfordii]|uniref:Uncharacterized protein n=1 Tax=Tripterygium wilfordii TaxID=458696 RepID=A0A7J7CUG8_TRIWF|nr:hypothetical protein HS088_TW13G00655 [Tripterygium wilfordii]